MYRCVKCDAPAQARCRCHENKEDSRDKREPPVSDPWGWKEAPRKLCIQSGVYVKTEELA